MNILNAMTSLNGFRTRMQTPFDRLAQQMEDVIGDGGILKEVIQSGRGPPAPANASVLAKFSGFQEYSDQPFVSNVHHQHPRMMKLGKDVTLRGLDLGLMTMKKGEFSRFLFTPEYAYGPMGCPPIIPPAARVLFEVELHDFLDMSAVDDFMELTLVERKDVPLSTVLSVVDTLRNCGNRSYTRNHYFEAKDDYKQALKILLHRDAASDAPDVRKALFPIYTNLALTELQLTSPKKALKYGTKALEINPDSAKALYRCAQACMELQDYEGAYDHLIKAQRLKPFDVDINELLRKVAIHYQEGMEQLKSVCMKMFRSCRVDPDPGPEKKM